REPWGRKVVFPEQNPLLSKKTLRFVGFCFFSSSKRAESKQQERIIGAKLMPSAARDPTTSRLLEQEIWHVEVVEQARSGDQRAFDTLFEYYNTRICTYLAHIVGNEEEGRDLAQETFLKAWQALGSIHNEASFDTWLYRIATNTAIDHLRRCK